MLNYEFMRYAFIIGIMIAILIPIAGQLCIQKGIAFEGDAISHTSLLGVAIGLIAGFSPIYGAIIISIISALLIELIRSYLKKYSEIAVVIVMALAIALSSVLQKYSNTTNFSSYLFGSILMVRIEDLIICGFILFVALFIYIGFYHRIRYMLYSAKEAKVAGINTRLLNIVITIIIAVSIAIASKIIGALLVSALMVIPFTSAIMITKSYKKSLLFSILYSFVAIVLGLTISYYFDFQPSGTIVIISITFLLLTLGFKMLIKNVIMKKR